jgi:hypothetical protein
MFLKSVQSWASSGAGQGATPYLTKPVPASEYDKYSLKNPRYKPKAVIPKPPTKKGSSSFGSIDYGATPTMKKLNYIYDANALKRPGGVKTPIATPYTRKKALEIFSKSQKAPEEKGPAEPKKPRMEQIKDLIQSMNPDDPIRTQLIQMLNVIQRLTLIAQKRPLTSQEETMIKEINFEIDKLIDEQEEQQNPKPMQQRPQGGLNQEDEELINDEIQRMELMARADPAFNQLPFNQRQEYLEQARNEIRQLAIRNNRYLQEREDGEQPAEEGGDGAEEGKYDGDDGDRTGYETPEEMPDEKTDDEQFERMSEVSEYSQENPFIPRRVDMYGEPADNYELFKLMPSGTREAVEEKIRFLNTGTQGPQEIIYKINRILSKYGMGFRNLWNRINLVAPGIEPINKLSNKAVLAVLIEFFENPRMPQGVTNAETIYKDIINGIAMPEDPDAPEEEPEEVEEPIEAKEERLIEPKGEESKQFPVRTINDIPKLINRLTKGLRNVTAEKLEDTMLYIGIDDKFSRRIITINTKTGKDNSEPMKEWLYRLYTHIPGTKEENENYNLLKKWMREYAVGSSL